MGIFQGMTAIILQSLEGVASLFILGLVGYILDRRGWFTPESRALIPRLVIVITLPLYLFVNVVSTFDNQALKQLVSGLVVPILSIAIIATMSWGASKLAQVSPRRSGMFISSTTSSNSIFIGLPLNMALFGSEALPYVLLYFFANTTFFWTFGSYLIRCDGELSTSKMCALDTVKRILSPPIVGFLVAITVVVSGINIPDVIMMPATQLGSMTTPLAIIFTGISLAGVKFKGFRLESDVVLVLVGRFIVNPLVVLALGLYFELPSVMVKVFVIQSSLPVMASVALLAGYYRADTTYASVLVSLSTLLALITVPAYMVILLYLVPG